MRTLLLSIIICCFFKSHAAKVDTLEIYSEAMKKSYKTAVVLPDSYAKSKSSYPVIYLLHGAYGHFQDWLSNTADKKILHDLADTYNVIIVTPEGENFSFYIDSPVNRESQFETYITQEVIRKIDQTYRTVSNKKGRVITGLSMGGHGALYLSARHPDLFAAAGSMSGAVDISAPDTETRARMNKMMEPVFGPQGATQEILASHSVMNMLDGIKTNQLELIIDCGVDDYLIDFNRELHRRMVYNKIPHDYTERPGAHTWDYWENAIPYHVVFFDKIFKKNGTHVK